MKVSADQDALDAGTRLKRLVEGQLGDDIEKLDREGGTMSDPAHWEGPRAQEFRAEWEKMDGSLREAQKAVLQLRDQADRILKAIMEAGGFTV